MSIWCSRVTLMADEQLARPAEAGAPYQSACTADGRYAGDVEALAELERGGFVDFATAPGIVGLARLAVGAEHWPPSDGLVYLDEAQVRALRDAMSAWLFTVGYRSRRRRWTGRRRGGAS